MLVPLGEQSSLRVSRFTRIPFSCWHSTEIFEAHLRVGMDLEAPPHAPLSKFCRRLIVVEPSRNTRPEPSHNPVLATL